VLVLLHAERLTTASEPDLIHGRRIGICGLGNAPD